jgi:hypothetical protein
MPSEWINAVALSSCRDMRNTTDGRERERKKEKERERERKRERMRNV